MNNKIYEPNMTNLGVNAKALNLSFTHRGSASTKANDFGSLTRGPKGWRRARANESSDALSPQNQPRLFSP